MSIITSAPFLQGERIDLNKRVGRKGKRQHYDEGLNEREYKLSSRFYLSTRVWISLLPYLETWHYFGAMVERRFSCNSCVDIHCWGG